MTHRTRNHTRKHRMPASFRGKKPKAARPYKPMGDPVYTWKHHLKLAKVREIVAKKNERYWTAITQDVKAKPFHPVPFDSANVQIYALRQKLGQ